MFCDDTETDDAFDQQTYYGYDFAGRTVAETIEDDGSRSAAQTYSWDKNGNATIFETGAGDKTEWVRDDGTENSDADMVTEMKRKLVFGATDFANSGTWMPFGPMEGYEHNNRLGGLGSAFIEAEFTWDDGYRPEMVQYKTTDGTNVLKIDQGWDSNGNLIKRDYTGAHSNVGDDHFTFDWLDRMLCNSTAASCTGTKKVESAYNTSGDRTDVYHNWTTEDYDTNYVLDASQETHQIGTVTYNDGSSRTISYSHDGRGNRLYDDDDQGAKDRRDYTYDARNNLITVEGTFKYSSNTTHEYTMTNAFDQKNRRVFKSFYDETDDKEAQWFFYYDVQDRLVEIKHTPNIADSSTYSLYNYYWIGQRPIGQIRKSLPGLSSTKYYIHADDQGRPLEMYNSSNYSSRQWAINPDAFGIDDVEVGSNVYQPLRFPGQYRDDETKAYSVLYGFLLFDGRPALTENRHRYYDSFTGSYMQVDPKVDDTWEAYSYANQNPAMFTDPTGEACNCQSPIKTFKDCRKGHGDSQTAFCEMVKCVKQLCSDYQDTTSFECSVGYQNYLDHMAKATCETPDPHRGKIYFGEWRDSHESGNTIFDDPESSYDRYRRLLQRASFNPLESFYSDDSPSPLDSRREGLEPRGEAVAR